ncbi:HNH endonuclease [Streptomyces sp. NPDC102467]|uniref:HNH endonuclease n=1 Tax=Streptomyces sp. NPDC102467 TaxID=3366179 RepID=UPI00382FBB1A
MLKAGIDVSRIATRAVRHTEEALREAVAESRSVKDVVRHLGISNVGGNHTHISRRIAALGIDISHFVSKHGKGPGARGDVLVLREPCAGRTPGGRLRRALLQAGTPEACAACEAATWTGQPIPLEVDHINGEWWDNRPENLRLLCPNCHAVTDTYRGRKRGVK